MNESAPEDKGKEVEAFIDALKDENEEVRGWAAHALGDLNDARAVDPLIDALKDKNKEVRKFAAGSLDKIGDK